LFISPLNQPAARVNALPRAGGRSLVALALAGLAALSLLAQGGGSAAIAGQIKDEQGVPMAGVTVVIRRAEADFRRETQTDEEGRFSYSGFSPGRYHLLVLREGEIRWWFPITLPPHQERLQVDIDLKKLREAAEERMTLSPELEQRREADRERAEREANLRSHYNRAARYLEEGEPENAIEELKAALAMEPERGSTYGMLGRAYAEAGQKEAAYEAYRRALELEPGEAAHYNNLGTLLAKDGRVEEALEDFSKAARLDPDRAATYQFNRGAALLNGSQSQEAVPLLRRASEADPTLAVAHFFLGLALFQSRPRSEGKPGEPVTAPPGAIEAFQRYLQLEPDGPYAEAARKYLEQLGAPASDMLLPAVPSPEDF
jgi:tetratricopeptide (TPR) repeat protein